uniref:Uncharacterized protein n=1 Tax=Rhizophora mucronata TaxID=61149 RepID=A0A2P2QX87_RHIMU
MFLTLREGANVSIVILRSEQCSRILLLLFYGMKNKFLMFLSLGEGALTCSQFKLSFYVSVFDDFFCKLFYLKCDNVLLTWYLKSIPFRR